MTTKRIRLVRAALAGGLAAVAAACSASPGEPPEEPEPAASSGGGEEDTPQTLQGHMAANFDLALRARDGVIAGSLIQAREAAVKLAETDYSVMLPPDWMPGVERMQGTARELAVVEDLKGAADRVAALAASCGDCHARLELDMGSQAADAPRLGFGKAEDMQARMLRHQHAADGFWFGLSVPSDSAWRSGAQTLLDAPMTPTDHAGKPVDARLAERVEEVRAIARRALQVTTLEDRAAVYGEFLGTCSSCHTGS